MAVRSEPELVQEIERLHDGVEIHAEEAGADLFLTKPFSPLDLLRLVDRLSGQSPPA
jgi:CheY-like chemotaxis protein